MAFDIRNMYIDRGRSNCAQGNLTLSIHTYTHTSDTLSTIAGAGYFTNYLGASAEDVKIGDLLFIQGSDDTRSYQLTGVAPVTIVEQTLSDNPYNQSLNTTSDVLFNSLTTTTTTTVGTNLIVTGNIINNTVTTFETTTWGGCFATPIAGSDNIVIQKIGRIVTINIPAAFGTATTPGLISLQESIPINLRPINDIYAVAEVQDNGTFKHGTCIIGEVNGNIIFNNGVSGTNFTGSGDTGFQPFTISYITP